jgi:hypothetical protein
MLASRSKATGSTEAIFCGVTRLDMGLPLNLKMAGSRQSGPTFFWFLLLLRFSTATAFFKSLLQFSTATAFVHCYAAGEHKPWHSVSGCCIDALVPGYDSWEPEANLHCPDLLRQFLREQPNKSASAEPSTRLCKH